MKKLAIIVTHPIQYYVPVFQLLAQQCELKVFYTWGEAGIKAKHDPGFRKTIAWDMPLLEGYEYELLTNTAADPGSHHGKGILNPDLIEKLSAFAPDAILVYGYIYHSHFKAMRHFKGKTPIWFRGDSTLLDPLPWYKAIAKTLYLRWLYSYVDKVFYVGTNNKAYFKKYGLKEEQLVFAPHAIDNDRFATPRTEEVSALRKSLNIAPEDILFLFAGKLEPKKNPELLLEAFIQVLKESEVRSPKFEEQGIRNKEQGKESQDENCPTTVISTTLGGEIYPEGNAGKDFSPEKIGIEKTNKQRTGLHLLFVGNGILESALIARSSYLNPIAIGSHIHFLDFQNQTQMPVVYQACDIFCLPSAGPGETWGLAINEAMAADKAIIASDQVGCALDLIKQGENGFIFKNNDIDELRQCLSYFIEDHKASLIFGTQSKAIITQWSFSQQVTALMHTLNERN